MKRKIIKIDEDRCTGCGLCIPNCPEGALQVLDGKARLVSDLFCDGLGACLGHCPEGAITVEEREAEPYDERRVMENIIKAGPETLRAHLVHLKDHNEKEYLMQAVTVLKEKGLANPLESKAACASSGGGCPGSRSQSFGTQEKAAEEKGGVRPSQLTHWPVQLHLISPQAPHFANSDLLLAADCTAFALGDFHKEFLKGKTLVIGCPKLDSEQEVYVEKLKSLIDGARINTLTVLIMQVPCCSGLLQLARQAASQAARRVPIKCVVVSLQGGILKEEWV